MSTTTTNYQRMPEHIRNSTINIQQYFYSRKNAIDQINKYGKTGTPFFFLISYDTETTIIIEDPLSSKGLDILFNFPGKSNHSLHNFNLSHPILTFVPPSQKEYAQKYKTVQEEFRRGNIYLLNLTHSTPVQSHATLEQIYHQSNAKYKVFVPGKFVVFSPETFVRIRGGKIFTYPMKGTIRDDRPNALALLRDNPKEKAEHASVVDLLRNDLGQVAKSVQVSGYRYFEKIQAGSHTLWQASSEIEGTLQENFSSHLGELIFTLLPAGSITGVPKQNAVTIIRSIENHDRGFYTGICGYYDGQNLDSGVMIRFIEQSSNGLVYKSGGGIHYMSNLASEYKELIEKIYVPVY